MATLDHVNKIAVPEQFDCPNIDTLTILSNICKNKSMYKRRGLAKYIYYFNYKYVL